MIGTVLIRISNVVYIFTDGWGMALGSCQELFPTKQLWFPIRVVDVD
jgi:hypothetical protein